MTAFVLGNGASRKSIDLNVLKAHGMIYGCNALYREFAPDVLVSTDPGISKEIQMSGYAKDNRYYTRRPFADSGALKLHPTYKGFSSGPNALQIAVEDGHTKIFLLGFDFGSTGDLFNNLYADTEFYKKSTDKATFGGNWINQILHIVKENPEIEFCRIVGSSSKDTLAFSKITNFAELNISEFAKRINRV